MKKFISEFKEFAVKGNVVDMAVGIIIGAAFGAIVQSLVADVVMPPIGMLLGNMDFSDLFVVLKEGNPGGPYLSLAKAKEAGAATVNYGVFLTKTLNFLVVALAVFVMVRFINRLRRQAETAPPAPTEKECPFCCMKVPIQASRCAHCTAELTK